MAGTNMAKSILSKLTYGNTTLKKGGRRRYKHKGGEDVVLEEFGKDDDVELDNLEGGKRRKHRKTKRTRRHKRSRSHRHI